MDIFFTSWLESHCEHIIQHLYKAVASSSIGATKSCKSLKEVIEYYQTKEERAYFKQIQFTKTQDITKSLSPRHVFSWFLKIATMFKQCEIFLRTGEIFHIRFIDVETGQVSIKKRVEKTLLMQEQAHNLHHNRIKEYPIPEGTAFIPFIQLGLMDERGRVQHAMRKKFVQVNTFILNIQEAIKRFFKQKPDTVLHIIDVGCGKGYITVALQYYFSQLYPNKIKVTGIDSREDVIEYCKKSFSKESAISFLSMSAGEMQQDRINTCQKEAIAVVALHACNIATDVALFKAVEFQADLFFVAPCCQAEVYSLLSTSYLPFICCHPTLKQKLSSLITDALRCAIMQKVGYQVDAIEFVDTEHTPKNTLLRGYYTGIKKEYSSEIKDLVSCLKHPMTLDRLINYKAKNS